MSDSVTRPMHNEYFGGHEYSHMTILTKYIETTEDKGAHNELGPLMHTGGELECEIQPSL